MRSVTRSILAFLAAETKPKPTRMILNGSPASAAAAAVGHAAATIKTAAILGIMMIP
jgi:hypothetical protein